MSRFPSGTSRGRSLRRATASPAGSASSEELPPGKQSNPLNFHMLEEEHVLILEGTVTLLLGESSYELSAGDYVCFPAGQGAGHALLIRGRTKSRYVVSGEHPHNDVLLYPETTET